MLMLTGSAVASSEDQSDSESESEEVLDLYSYSHSIFNISADKWGADAFNSGVNQDALGVLGPKLSKFTALH